MPYDLRQLEHFVAVARHGNYARAAEALGLAQPTLTRSIQALERHVGTRLLDRGRAGATPTSLGNELLERAEALLKRAGETERDMRLLAGLGVGHVNIGGGAYAADISLGIAAGRFTAKYPRLSLDISIDDWTELTGGLLEGVIDLAVAEISEAMDDDRFLVEPLPHHAAVLFCRVGHPLLASGASLTLADLARYPLASTNLPRRLEQALGMTGGGGFTTRIRTDTFDMIRQIVLASDAIAGAVPSQIAADVRAGRLATLPLELPALHSGYGVIRLAGRTPSPAAVAFIEELQCVESEIAAAEAAARESRP